LIKSQVLVNFIGLCFVALISGQVWAEEGAGHLRMGLGIESRLQNQVNPDIYDLNSTPMIFQGLQFGHWTYLTEFGFERSTSRSGAFEVRRRSLLIGAWARYALENEWMPYVSVGVGVLRHQLSLAFEGSMTERTGAQGRVGLGFGWEVMLTKNLVLGAEARAALIQDHREPQLSFFIGTGVHI